MDFIPAEYYNVINLLIILFLSSIYIPKYNRLPVNSAIIDPNNGFFIAVFFILFIGLRPISEVFVDMTQYQGVFNRWSGVFVFNIFAENFIYDNLMYFCASIQFPPVLFYLMIAAIYYGCAHLACLKMFPRNSAVAFLVFLAAFSTFSYGTNGIKAGAAASIFLLALAYRDKLWLSIVLAIVSLGFHHAMQLPVAAYVLTLFYKNPKAYFAAWVFCFLMAAAHVTAFQSIFAGFSDERGASYLMSDDKGWGGKGGFRIDFIIYSAMPVLVGYWAIYKKKMQLSKFYSNLLNMYLCTNGIWMLCMYVEYTNRIAYLSWFIYPIVLIYPFLNEDWGPSRYRTFYKVAWAHLAFTLFMSFVYYA